MAQIVTKGQARLAYRYLLRSIAIAFQDDNVTLTAASKEARRRFELGKELDPQSNEAIDGVKEATDVAKFLRQNLVQGQQIPNSDVFRKSCIRLGITVGLRIHDETERGDNSSIKNPIPLPKPARKPRRKPTELS
jgi:hypothetical protein